ncbi:Oligoribonuclease [Candidatus Kinetoplastibacterium sorsogonicusi]|uniref:Oligoribonuclease n=1 Tax=Candidatus Kinetoplastidibacterium kentomonadis TaxID=1576550 RepID=A0A3Q8ERD8_9PROT|nr:oligoribonuclease [Candidatus Kinetoplastibacterium sorsogonicusi]AWD32519.1 Oligoribonuclease [Candidatus Kinetoplastibacterium sorsogonicusi]
MHKFLNKNNFKSSNWVWIDMEMTGLNPEIDYILEIAIVITDYNLNIIAESPSIVIYQPDSILDTMNDWNYNTHTKTGLLKHVKKSNTNEQTAEIYLLNFISNFVAMKESPLCGNTVSQDRKFLTKYMPILESFFHYRNIDVSSIKEIAKAWYPNDLINFQKKNNHSALSDIYESIEELKFYKKRIFKFL